MDTEQVREHVKQLLDNFKQTTGTSYRKASIQIKKNEAYLHQYVNYKNPLRLDEDARRRLSKMLKVPEQELTDLDLSDKDSGVATGMPKDDFVILFNMLSERLEETEIEVPMEKMVSYVYIIYDAVKVDPKEKWKDKVIFLTDALVKASNQ